MNKFSLLTLAAITSLNASWANPTHLERARSGGVEANSDFTIIVTIAIIFFTLLILRHYKDIYNFIINCDFIRTIINPLEWLKVYFFMTLGFIALYAFLFGLMELSEVIPTHLVVVGFIFIPITIKLVIDFRKEIKQ